MIIEAILATVDPTGRPNFAPMGVRWGEEEMVIRPFRTTHTYKNLVRTGCAVVNVTDDVLAFVEAALGEPELPHEPSETVPGVVLTNACFWRELRLQESDGAPDRAELRMQVVGRGWRRDFLGFNRARGAIIEAAIMATRLHLLGQTRVLAALQECETVVLKTGDHAEWLALQRLRDYVRGWPDEAAR